MSWIGTAFRWLSLNEWVTVAALLYTATCLLWVIGRYWRAATYRPVLYAALGLCALVLFTVGAKVHATRGVERCVVTVSKVDVTSGPGETYTAEFSLHEGAEVRIEHIRDGWLRVSVGEKLRRLGAGNSPSANLNHGGPSTSQPSCAKTLGLPDPS